MTTRSDVERFVAEPAVALVGMSRSGRKFGNAAARELISKGYRVYPIHPAASEIDGVRCFSTFDELPERVNAVLVVVRPAEVVQVVRDAARAGIHQVWLQQGAESPEALQVCRSLGQSVVAGECILMFAKPASFHRLHRWLRQVFGRMPH